MQHVELLAFINTVVNVLIIPVLAFMVKINREIGEIKTDVKNLKEQNYLKK